MALTTQIMVIDAQQHQQNKRNKSNRGNQKTGIREWGVAILIRGNLEHHINHIRRIGLRILQITPHSAKSHMTDTILATYAPQKGYQKRNKKNSGGVTPKPPNPFRRNTWPSGVQTWMGTRNHKRKWIKKHQNCWAAQKNRQSRTMIWNGRKSNMCTTTHDTNEHMGKSAHNANWKTKYLSIQALRNN